MFRDDSKIELIKQIEFQIQEKKLEMMTRDNSTPESIQLLDFYHGNSIESRDNITRLETKCMKNLFHQFFK